VSTLTSAPSRSHRSFIHLAIGDKSNLGLMADRASRRLMCEALQAFKLADRAMRPLMCYNKAASCKLVPPIPSSIGEVHWPWCDRVQLTRTCAGPGRPLADTAEWPSNSVLLSVAAANGLSCDVANRNASAISFYRIRLGPGGVALALKRCR